MKIRKEDAEKLAGWYRHHKRKLPWRDTGNPYDVWVSEIMLQQTRIEAVIPKYRQFMKELPSIGDLAACSQDRLMTLWAGLGYYSRAVNLKKAAQVIVSDYNGLLPDDYHLLQKLPGIGAYTAGAIASICYGIAVPAADGNVMRVLARFFEVGDDVRNTSTKKKLTDTLSNIYADGGRNSFYGDFNQGLMELGETVCVPNGAPVCEQCPWQAGCACHANNTWDEIPWRSPLKERRIVERTLFVLKDADHFILHKRPDRGLLGGMYEFIGTDAYEDQKEAAETVEKMGFTPLHTSALPDSKHVFTHMEWRMKAWEIQIAQPQSLPDNMIAVSLEQMKNDIALPSAFRTYVRWYG